MSDHRYWVGPLGRLRPLPDVYSDVNASPTRIGGISTSLYGTRTVDTLGYSRGWSWSWTSLNTDQAAWVQAIALGLLPTPLRLVDPHLPNRLPTQIASGGSQRRTPDGFNTSAGAISWHTQAELTDPATLGPGLLLSGALYWLLTRPGGGRLYPADDTFDGTWRAPIIATDDRLEVSVWIAGIPGLDTAVTWREYTEADLAAGTFTEHEGAGMTPLTYIWQKAAVTFAPDPASVAVSMALRVGGNSPDGWLAATGWQIATPAKDPLPPFTWSAVDDSTGLHGDWHPGGGAPRVAVDTSGLTHKLPGLHDMALALIDTGG